MGKTITEKILARAAGLSEVSAGQEIRAKPDFVLAYDFPGQTDAIFHEMKHGFGIERLAEPERFGMFIDHFAPAGGAEMAAFHETTRQWCRENGVPVYEHKGIGHHVAAEVGYACPGGFVVHFDGHISQLGAYGTLAIGLRRSLIEAFVRETVTITVPKTVRIDLTGTLGPGVMSRDVFHYLVRLLGPASCSFQMLELGGPALADFTTDGLQAFSGLAMFIGAISAIVNPDDDTRYALASQKSRKSFGRVCSDPDANYSARYTVDVSQVEPLIVIPPNPANTRDLKDYLGMEVSTGYVGSCVSGRLEDMQMAARILEGRRVKPGFTLNIVPTSQEILSAAASDGTLGVLINAGAFIGSSTCDFCNGRLGAMKEGQRAISTGTLNVRGRMGHVNAEIYIGSAATVAASAIEGKLADPRKYLEGR